MKTKKIKEKNFYICDNCKKVGIKSYKVKTFEPFDCPVCKKTTTLFLPKKKQQQEPIQVIEQVSTIEKKENRMDNKKIEISYRNNSSSLKFFIFFMIGFITALFLTKN